LDRVIEEVLEPAAEGADGAGPRWTAPLLRERLASRSGRRFSGETVRRRLRRLGYIWKRGRYVRRPEPSMATPEPA
jgi:transposase